jgi:3-hydroxymyristoyl/3-hydroxydecanoyl-(acyl carrier protein) dehydratase
MILPDLFQISRDGDEIEVAFDLSADHAAFAGHFPGKPILPGVIQIDWVMYFAGLHFGIATRAAQDFQVKFRRTILPGKHILLKLRYDSRRAQIGFEYYVADEIASSGKIKLGERV